MAFAAAMAKRSYWASCFKVVVVESEASTTGSVQNSLQQMLLPSVKYPK